MKRRRLFLYTNRTSAVIICFVLMIFYSCAERIHLTPHLITNDHKDFRLRSKIIFEGNADYLPRVLSDEQFPDSKYAFRYTYNSYYGQDDIPDLVTFINPLTIIGFPTGESDLTIIGNLELLKDESAIKSYVASCTIKKTRNLFSSKTFSDLRKRGLIEIRNNIEMQLYQDKDYLNELFPDI